MIQHVLAQTTIDESRGGPIGLVIAPTRELEIQIFVAAHPFCKSVGFEAICLSGGNNYHQQEIQLSNGVDIAVCTPGRLIQHTGERNKDLHQSSFIVSDKGDRLFDLSFGPQINSVTDTCRPDRKTLMFFATFGLLPEKFAQKELNNPSKLAVGTTKLQQIFFNDFITLQEHEKDKLLQYNLITMMAEGKVIIIVNNREKKTGKNINVLLTTNVGARGLDIAEVRNIINYNVANNRDIHIHQIRRTGRAGQSGIAYTLLTKEDGAVTKNILSILTSDENKKQICEFYFITT